MSSIIVLMDGDSQVVIPVVAKIFSREMEE